MRALSLLDDTPGQELLLALSTWIDSQLTKPRSWNCNSVSEVALVVQLIMDGAKSQCGRQAEWNPETGRLQFGAPLHWLKLPHGLPSPEVV